MPFTVTFTTTAFVAGSLRSSGNTLLVDDPTARMLVDLGVATAPGLTAQTGAVVPNLASRVSSNVHNAGTKNTFSHSATTAGLNVGPVAGDPSSLANGDVWLNSTTNALNARVNGANHQLNGVKAWVNFNGTGTVAIRGSYNVSSITDNGVGLYTVNFATAMPDANYAVSGLTATGTGGWVAIGQTWADTTQQDALTTASVKIRVTEETNVAIDTDPVCVTIFR